MQAVGWSLVSGIQVLKSRVQDASEIVLIVCVSLWCSVLTQSIHVSVCLLAPDLLPVSRKFSLGVFESQHFHSCILRSV